MNAQTLIEAIAEQAGVYLTIDDEDAKLLGDFEVKLAVQPSWPFEHRIASVIGPDEIQDRINEEAECPEHEGYLIGHANCDVEFEQEERPSVIYIAEGGQDGYLNSDAKSALGWGRGVRY